MGLYYDKRRNKWNARISVGNNKRVYLGAYSSDRDALLACLRAELMYEMLKQTADQFVPEYIEDDSGIKWLAPFRKAKLQKLADKMEIVILSSTLKLIKRQSRQKARV